MCLKLDRAKLAWSYIYFTESWFCHMFCLEVRLVSSIEIDLTFTLSLALCYSSSERPKKEIVVLGPF